MGVKLMKLQLKQLSPVTCQAEYGFFASRSIFLANKGVATRSLLVFFVLENLLAIPIAVLIGSLLLASSSAIPYWVGWVSAVFLITVTTLARPILHKALVWWAKRKDLETRAKFQILGSVKCTFHLVLLVNFWNGFLHLFTINGPIN